MSSMGSVGSSPLQRNVSEKSAYTSHLYKTDDYITAHKAKPNVSRKRQNLIENRLNDIFEEIADSCIVFDKSKLFHYPVRKNVAMDYQYIIMNPIDLTTIKNKSKRGGN